MTLPTSLPTEQAPPLSIPVSFFLLVPLSMVAGGALLAWEGPRLLHSRWTPGAAAFAHLGTLGLLGSAMLGALYQMLPVVAVRPVVAPRLAHLVHAIYVVGVAALVWGLLEADRAALRVAYHALGLALVLFLVPVGHALLRSEARTDTVRGMRLAVGGLVAVGALGVLLARGLATFSFAGDWNAWHATHVALGLVVWVGGLIASVSWQVLPMFYVADPVASWARKVVLVGIALTLVAAPAALLAGATAPIIAATAVPGALAVWLVHPVTAARVIAGRRRRRADASLNFWWAGLLLAPATLLAAIAAVLLDEPRLPVLWGWLAIWGWAGLIVHGMLTRIVPFLVWFHRMSPHVGRVPVPAMRQLLPDRRARAGLVLHLAALVLGLGALATGAGPLARATGVVLAAAGIRLGVSLAVVLGHRAPVAPAERTAR